MIGWLERYRKASMIMNEQSEGKLNGSAIWVGVGLLAAYVVKENWRTWWGQLGNSDLMRGPTKKGKRRRK